MDWQWISRDRFLARSEVELQEGIDLAEYLIVSAGNKYEHDEGFKGLEGIESMHETIKLKKEELINFNLCYLNYLHQHVPSLDSSAIKLWGRFWSLEFNSGLCINDAFGCPFRKCGAETGITSPNSKRLAGRRGIDSQPSTI